MRLEVEVLSFNFPGVILADDLQVLNRKHPPVSSPLIRAGNANGQMAYFPDQVLQRGMWEQLLDTLTVLERKRQERQETFSMLDVDSTERQDGGLREPGRRHRRRQVRQRAQAAHSRRHARPALCTIVVTVANVSDTAAGCELANRLRGEVPRLEKIGADYTATAAPSSTMWKTHMGGKWK